MLLLFQQASVMFPTSVKRQRHWPRPEISLTNTNMNIHNSIELELPPDRSADNFSEDDRDMRIMVRGGVYEVDLAEWKCHSIYWPGEAFDIMRGTW